MLQKPSARNQICSRRRSWPYWSRLTPDLREGAGAVRRLLAASGRAPTLGDESREPASVGTGQRVGRCRSAVSAPAESRRRRAAREAPRQRPSQDGRGRPRSLSPRAAQPLVNADQMHNGVDQRQMDEPRGSARGRDPPGRRGRCWGSCSHRSVRVRQPSRLLHRDLAVQPTESTAASEHGTPPAGCILRDLRALARMLPGHVSRAAPRAARERRSARPGVSSAEVLSRTARPMLRHATRA
jgi:hypothetical protein